MKLMTAFAVALAVLGFAVAASACERYKPVVDEQVTAGTPVIWPVPDQKDGS